MSNNSGAQAPLKRQEKVLRSFLVHRPAGSAAAAKKRNMVEKRLGYSIWCGLSGRLEAVPVLVPLIDG